MITGFLLFIVCGLIFLSASPSFNLYLVRSESMKPTINMGDLIITRVVKSPSDSGIKAGTIITYTHSMGLVTHRIVGVNNDSVTTRGDAMEDNDPWKVALKDIKDIYVFRIPYIGRLITMVGTKTGWLIAIVLPGLALMGFLIKDIIKEAFSDSKA